jgi:outer membrane protein assembly factor BamB
MRGSSIIFGLILGASALGPPLASAGDWPQWGGHDGRNAVSDEKGLPDAFDPGKRKPGSKDIDLATTRNVKWVAKLGSQTYGNPVVAGGRVFVGTNDSSRRDPRHKGDGGGAVLCLDEATGKLLWELIVPRMQGMALFDNLSLGICSSPTVDDERVYVMTNRCQMLCLDVRGMANDNDGPFKDEGAFMTPQGRPRIELGPTDADIIWCYDLLKEGKMSPHDAASSAALIHGDLLYVGTSNSVDSLHAKVPRPQAPSLIVLNKHTGQLLAEDDAKIGTRLLHGQWSSPSLARVGQADLILYGGGDGMCYAFDAVPRDSDGGAGLLPTAWSIDCNPPDCRTRDGRTVRYGDRAGPSEIIATPVFQDGKVYVAVGQDPRHGSGKARLSCIDVASGLPDGAKPKLLWSYDAIDRTLASATIAGDLLFIPDISGHVYCLDARTGKPHWVHDAGAQIWATPLVADGKVYIGTDRRKLLVMAASSQLRIISQPTFTAPIYTSAIAANGVLYVTTQEHLYAIAQVQP